MRLLHYLEIDNFKQFAGKRRIELDHPSVLIGPNNCGKTSAIQAIALWSQVVKAWYQTQVVSSPKTHLATPLSRFQIGSEPVWHRKYFGNNPIVHKNKQNIPMTISVGLQYDDKVERVTMRFRNEGEDLISCTPDDAILDKPEVLDAAASLNINLLYPMSGLRTEEPALLPIRIDGLMGPKQTAQVLRNLCLFALNDSSKSWGKIVGHMRHMFSIELHKPAETPRGTINLFYNQKGVRVPLDISFAGQGLQQTLLVLICLYAHNRSVLLLDEPDTHLEILRQKQIYILLRDIARETESQVVLTTHSEVLIDEGLRDGNLTLLLERSSENLANKKDVQDALKYYNAPHYLRARQCGHVLYLEGNTDFHILHAFAKKLDHPAAQSWGQPINLYFVRDNYPEPDMDSELERVEGGFGVPPKTHFFALRKLVPGLRGLVILDGDGKARKNIKNHLPTVFWKRYEIESYFITRELLTDSIQNHYREHPLLGNHQKLASKILDSLIQKHVFGNKRRDFNIWNESPSEVQQLLWEEKTKTCKLSNLAEEFYRKFAATIKSPMMYTKGKLYQLIELVEPESIPEEVTEKLDRLQDLLENSAPQE